MGFRRERKIYKLKFEDPDLAGLEVLARSLPLGEFFKMSSLTEGAENMAGVAAQAEQLFREFAKSLVSWNLEDEKGRPVPADYDGIQGQEFDFVLAIITAWMEAMASVRPPLPMPSSNGATFPEASLPMASLSPSLVS